MKRTLVALGVLVAGFTAFRAGLEACGDKSLSFRGARLERARLAQNASILILVHPNSRMTDAAREMKLQLTLKQYGYTYREVSSLADAEAALASGEYHIVMADLMDGTDLQQRVKASQAVVVPVAFRLSKTETKQAEKQYRFLVKAPSNSARYLSTIADAVRSRPTRQ